MDGLSGFSVSKKPDDAEDKSGRVTFDERGQPVWQWRVDTGEYRSDVDTMKVRQIQEEVNVTLKEDEPVAPTGFDPYGRSSEPPRSFRPKAPPPQAPKPRRTLDDMRKLSEEIKRQRALQQKK
jgi:hypothetical protein